MRGWSRRSTSKNADLKVLPAGTGLVPPPRTWAELCRCAPRGYGAGPREVGSVATDDRVPRRCGTGPGCGCCIRRPRQCSPRVRVWSRLDRTLLTEVVALPRVCGWSQRTSDPLAVRGVGCSPRVRGWPRPAASRSRCAPRVCGADPGQLIMQEFEAGCSLRAWGWFHAGRHRRMGGGALPASAELVPTRTSRF